MKLNILVALIVGIACSSCEENNFHFNNPQPEDSKSIYTIPGKYRGTWQLNPDKTGINTLTIGKDYYTTIARSGVKTKAELELDSNVYFVGDKIYYSEEGKLQGGYKYVVEGDNVIIENVEYVEFGKNAFLREFDYGYVLNLKLEGMTEWYDLRFIDTRNKEGIIIKEIGKDDLKGKVNYEIIHEDFEKHIVAHWTKQDFQNFIDNGGFSRELVFLKYKEKIKN